ncbi:MAG: SdpI family protein, partial [Aureispira sp.]
VIIMMSSGRAPANPTILLGGCFILFMLLFGNYAGSIRPNYFIGIRTPWTLQSDEVWRKTHRLAGRLLIGAALIGLVLLLLLPSSWGMLGVVALMVGALLIPVVYSFLLFRKLDLPE